MSFEIEYRRIGGRNVRFITLDGLTLSTLGWSQRTGVTKRAIQNRLERLPDGFSEQELRSALTDSSEKRKAAKLKGLKRRKKRKNVAVQKAKEMPCFAYDLNHLLALGCPLAIRAEFARRMREQSNPADA